MSVIPKEQIAAYERWQVDRFDEPEAPPASEEAAPPVAESSPHDDAGELVSGIGLPTAEDIERIHSEAQQEGYNAGYEAGFTEGQQAGLATAQATVEQMAGLLGNLQTALRQMDQTVADAVLELALETARQVVRSSVRSQPELLLPVIREAIACLPLHHGTINLHVHPDDGRFLREHLGDQLAANAWHVIDDPEIEAGGCHLKAGASEVDATLATRWQRVLESIGAPATPPAAADE